MVPIRRVAVVTVGLALTGAAVGAMLSPLLLLAMGLAYGRPVLDADLSFLRFPAAFGAVAGAILAPVASWTLMRHVPIWRAIVETLLGTILGASIGMFLWPVQQLALLWPIIFGILGFTVAAARLRWSRGAKPPATTPVPIA
jgi:hypothetical protein